MNKGNSRLFILALLATIIYVSCISYLIIDSMLTKQNGYNIDKFVSKRHLEGQCHYYNIGMDDDRLRIGVPKEYDSYYKNGNVYVTLSSNYSSNDKELDDVKNHTYVLEFSIDGKATQELNRIYKFIWRIGDFLNLSSVDSIVTRTVASNDSSYLYNMCVTTENRVCSKMFEAYNYYTFPREYFLKNAIEITPGVSKGMEFSGPINKRLIGAFRRAFIVAKTKNPNLSITAARFDDSSLNYDSLNPTTIMYRLNLLDNINKLLDQCNKESLR